MLSPDREVLELTSKVRLGVSSDRAEDSASLASAEMEFEMEPLPCAPHVMIKHKEILEVVSHAVARLQLDWPQEQETPKRSNLDDRFLSVGQGERPQCRSLSP